RASARRRTQSVRMRRVVRVDPWQKNRGLPLWPGPVLVISLRRWRGFSGEAGLDLVDDRCKPWLVENRHVGKHLAIDLDLGLLQACDERRIRQTLVTHRCIDARNPERTEHTLALPAVAIGVLTRLHDRFFGDAEDALPALRVALRLAQDF